MHIVNRAWSDVTIDRHKRRRTVGMKSRSLIWDGLKNVETLKVRPDSGWQMLSTICLFSSSSTVALHVCWAFSLYTPFHVASSTCPFKMWSDIYTTIPREADEERGDARRKVWKLVRERFVQNGKFVVEDGWTYLGPPSE